MRQHDKQVPHPSVVVDLMHGFEANKPAARILPSAHSDTKKNKTRRIGSADIREAAFLNQLFIAARG